MAIKKYCNAYQTSWCTETNLIEFVFLNAIDGGKGATIDNTVVHLQYVSQTTLHMCVLLSRKSIKIVQLWLGSCMSLYQYFFNYHTNEITTAVCYLLVYIFK